LFTCSLVHDSSRYFAQPSVTSTNDITASGSMPS
jgi:hypothetical protein